MKVRGQTVYPLEERLSRLSKLNKESGCIEWIGSTRNGYGRLMIGSRTDGSRRSASAHRVAFELAFGVSQKGLLVLHKCDNKKCINPKHLFLGTHKDNTLDMMKKGRHKSPFLPEPPKERG